MPLPRDIAGKAQKRQLEHTAFYSKGDYVVPEYSESGAKTAQGQVVGDPSEVMEMSKMIASHALMEGGEMLPDVLPPTLTVLPKPEKRKPGPKPKAVKHATAEAVNAVVPQMKADGFNGNTVEVGQTTPAIPLAPSGQPSTFIEVVFSTQLGRIKVNALAVLNTDNALALVFANDAAISFEPATGSNVQLVINGQVYNTMYPGFRFTWMDNKIQLMVFVKLSE